MPFKMTYDKQNLTLMVFMKLAEVSFHKFYMNCHKCKILYISYNVGAFQLITSCHKNQMTTRVTAFRRVNVTSLTTSVSTMRFLIEIIIIFKAVKSHFNESFDKQNLTRVVILYEIL